MKTDDPRAPGPLETVRQFVNTHDLEDEVDTIATAATLGAWMREHELLDPADEVGDQDVARAQELRESLRACLLAHHQRQPPPASARDTLNRVAARAELSLTLDAAGQWRPRAGARGADGALGELLAVVAGATTAGTWDRLKVCQNDACRWAFYDHSRARSGRWCSMQVCGNRAKQQAWRDRRARTQR